MIKKYFDFRSFFLLESLLKVDKDLHVILSKISDKDPVAKMLVGLINQDITTNVNYLKSSDKNDDIKFVNDTQVSRFIDADIDPFERAANTAKIGRTIRQILTLNKISVTDSQIEQFVNSYKSAWDIKNKKGGFQLVSGDEIKHWYLEDNYVGGGGQLNNSCMRYDTCYNFFDIYIKNPDVCQLLIMLDDRNKLLGRALVWKLMPGTGKSEYFLDRIYTRFDSDIYKFEDWFRNYLKISEDDDFSGHILGITQGCKVQLKNWKFKFYPYMDSLYILDYETGILGTYDSKDNKKLQFILQQTGGLPSVPGYVYSKKYDKWYKNDQCVYFNDQDDYFPLEDCKKDYLGTWRLKDEVVYSEYLKDWVYSKRAVELTGFGIVDEVDIIFVYDDVDEVGNPKNSKKNLKSKIEDSDYKKVEVGWRDFWIKSNHLVYDPFNSQWLLNTKQLKKDFTKLQRIDHRNFLKLRNIFGPLDQEVVYFKSFGISDSYTILPIIFDFTHGKIKEDEGDYYFIIDSLVKSFKLEDLVEKDNKIFFLNNIDLDKGFKKMCYSHSVQIFNKIAKNKNVDIKEYLDFLQEVNSRLLISSKHYKNLNLNYDKMIEHASYLKFYNTEIAEKFEELKVLEILQSDKFIDHFIDWVSSSESRFEFTENYREPDEEVIEISKDVTDLKSKVKRFFKSCRDQILFVGYWYVIICDMDDVIERYNNWAKKLSSVNTNLLRVINLRERVGSDYASSILSLSEFFEYLDIDNIFKEFNTKTGRYFHEFEHDAQIFNDFIQRLDKRKQ
jgi:hypothetical protein